MTRLRSVVSHALLIAAFGAIVAAQDAPPKAPFKAVHLMNLRSAADVAAVQAAIDDMNTVLANAGYRDVRYRFYKATGKQAGEYTYLWESSWPGGEVYEKVHKSPEWLASSKKHPRLEELSKDSIYNRYVEVPPARR
jgi:hypothetical protein